MLWTVLCPTSRRARERCPPLFEIGLRSRAKLPRPAASQSRLDRYPAALADGRLTLRPNGRSTAAILWSRPVGGPRAQLFRFEGSRRAMRYVGAKPHGHAAA